MTKEIIYLLQLLITFQILLSCTLFDQKHHELDEVSIPYLENDYVDHMNSLVGSYLGNSDTIVIKLNSASTKYLQSIYKRIVLNNQLLLHEGITPQFNIIKSKKPFYFSLPTGHFYLSTNLLNNYLKNEDLLVSVLTFVFIKSLRRIYLKKIIPPLGFISTKRILSLVNIPLEQKNRLNQWVFYTMKRSGYDPSAYLLWLQIQNKHSLDFSTEYGNIQSISREELLFKSFIADKESIDKSIMNRRENSSDSFYLFLKDVVRKSI